MLTLSVTVRCHFGCDPNRPLSVMHPSCMCAGAVRSALAVLQHAVIRTAQQPETAGAAADTAAPTAEGVGRWAPLSGQEGQPNNTAAGFEPPVDLSSTQAGGGGSSGAPPHLIAGLCVGLGGAAVLLAVVAGALWHRRRAARAMSPQQCGEKAHAQSTTPRLHVRQVDLDSQVRQRVCMGGCCKMHEMQTQGGCIWLRPCQMTGARDWGGVGE